MESKKITNTFMLIIIVLLLILVLGNRTSKVQYVPNNNGYASHNIAIVNIGNNRILIMDPDINSGSFGKVMVLEYDEKNLKFKVIQEEDLKNEFRGFLGLSKR